jgi:arginyl-tRNA synthetase
MPKDGYLGEYVKEMTATLLKIDPDLFQKPTEMITTVAVGEVVKRQQEDLGRMGVSFDRWFHEKGLHPDRVNQALAMLKDAGVVARKEGAEWFMATAFGDEKDRVLIKSDGAPTYTLPDVAYHLDKYGRGYTRMVDIVGADHQTEMATLKMALKVLGMETDRLEVIITQFVNLKRGTEKVVMSKRSGNVIPLSELVDEVGVDAARFFFLLRAPSSHLDFDLDLAKSTTMDNPVYYIQYAHARLCSLIERAKAEGMPPADPAFADPALLQEPETRLVMRRLARYPFLVEKAAAGRAPHLITHELMELAQAIHQFYTHNRVVGAPTPEIGQARLALASAARQVVANGLGLLGVSAPERM